MSRKALGLLHRRACILLADPPKPHDKNKTPPFELAVNHLCCASGRHSRPLARWTRSPVSREHAADCSATASAGW